MSPIRASFQSVFIECLESMLAPLVRLTLYCGLGHSEFAATVRRVFINVASEEYGVRGRPANASKISAKTGISRKSIQRFRTVSSTTEWSPDDEVSPVNSIIHYWRFDEQFGSRDGLPRELPYEGEGGFVSLVKKYAGDIPPSTIRQEFLREGIAKFTDSGLLKLVRDFSFPEKLDEDFLRNAAFAIGNHAQTLFHNALLADSERNLALDPKVERRFERIAWSRRLTEADSRSFEQWIRQRSEEFISEANEYISSLEAIGENNKVEPMAPVSGIGVYYFRVGK